MYCIIISQNNESRARYNKANGTVWPHLKSANSLHHHLPAWPNTFTYLYITYFIYVLQFLICGHARNSKNRISLD